MKIPPILLLHLRTYLAHILCKAPIKPQQFFRHINIRLVLSALEIQTTDLFERSKNGGTELSSYKTYVVYTLKKSDAFKDISFDHGMFIR